MSRQSGWKRFQTSLFACSWLICLTSILLPEFSQANHPDPSKEFDPYGIYSAGIGSGYLRHAVPLDAELNFEKLISMIGELKIVKIEDLLEALPAEMKNDNYVLAYRSRSLQEATPSAPRAIVYTPTASLLLAFNGGDPRTRGANTLEVIQFRRAESRFEFRELEFDGKTSPKVSAANPAKCLQCHQDSERVGIDMRPNWEPYSTWLGFFGSDNGRLSKSPLGEALEAQHLALAQDAETLKEQAHEEEFLKNYLQNVAPVDRRYSKLGSFNLHAPADLTNHLQIWNLKRVARLMTEQAEIYKPFQEIIAMLAQCEYDESFTHFPYFQWADNQPIRKYFHFTSPGELSNVVTRIFEPLGVNTSDWSMDFGTRGRFAFQQRFGAPSNTTPMFHYAWQTTVPDAEQLTHLNCKQLRVASARRLSPFMDAGAPMRLRQAAEVKKRPPVVTARQLLNRCAQCHAGSTTNPALGVPQLPFDQVDHLKSALVRGGYPAGRLIDEIGARTSEMASARQQMPPTARLNPEEQAILMNYLRGLISGQTAAKN